MNDVLPKPFTKEGMLRALEKHLPEFRKDAPFPASPAPMAHPSGFATPNSTQPNLGMNMAPLSAAQPMKEETSPGKSPATATSWESPGQLPGQMPGQMLGQMPGPSPIHTSGSYMQQQPMSDARQYNMTPTHGYASSGFPAPTHQGMVTPRAGGHRRGMSDMAGGPPDDHADKRQRMYPPPQGPFP